MVVPFLYMSLCCYRSLFTLRIFGAFRLQVTPPLAPLALCIELALALLSVCAITYCSNHSVSIIAQCVCGV